MAEIDSGKVLTKKHLLLLKYAKVSEIFSWVVLVFAFIAGLLRVLTIGNIIQEYCTVHRIGGSIQLLDLFFQPLVTPFYVADIILTILRWLIFFIVLRSIALALRMLVETDVNYRLQTEEGRINEEL